MKRKMKFRKFILMLDRGKANAVAYALGVSIVLLTAQSLRSSFFMGIMILTALCLYLVIDMWAGLYR